VPAAPREPLVRVRAVVAYDGAHFRGFAANVGVRTVAGTLTDAITKVLGHRVTLTGAGRTDAGVHAWGQVVTFDTNAERFDTTALQRAINAQCGPALVVREVATVGSDFDARHSARSRRYRYHVHVGSVPDPFLVGRAWHVTTPLDQRAMELACDALIGEHDFSAFCRRPRGRDGKPDASVSLRRHVLDASWINDGEARLRFEIEATAFCHQMVRSIVGTLVDVGRGRRRAGDVLDVVRGRDRSRAGPVAPPHGLYLWAVRYDGWSSDLLA
jgi:tRNA pseudouridine38-40 synthase